MSTMPAQHGHSQACCNVPPVVTKDYKGKGSYEELGGLKTYVTGPSDATKAIVVVFDIFGYYPQTVQGADILAASDDAHKYRVYVPDWFHGEPCPLAWYPPDTEEKQKNLGGFFQKNPPGGVADQLPAYVRALRAASPQVTSVGVVGMCWGGKAVSLVAGKGADNPFAAAVEVHPAMVDPADAQAIEVPLALLASQDEDAEAVTKFSEALKVPKHVETFSDQIHGWMGARGDLENERVRSEYVRGYETVLKFFAQHL